MTMLTRAISCAFALTLTLGIYAHAEVASSSGLSLTSVRAIRIADTTISLSYTTSQDAIGSVTYTTSSGQDITLSDSVPETDHLFTIGELDPSHGYTFTLNATHGSSQTNNYVVLLAPDRIGNPGQSIVPGLQVVGADGGVISSTLVASTAPYSAHTPSLWFVVLFLAAIAAAGGFYFFHRRSRQQPAETSL